MKKLSIVTPAFNEEENLPALRAELAEVTKQLSTDWEWIILDDHSPDGTWEVIRRFAGEDARIKGLRMARNEGSRALYLLGLQKASGDCALTLAADGQDSPAHIPQLLDEMAKGSRIVWLTREGGRGDPFLKSLMARFYYFVMRRIIGLASIPPTGSDMVLVDALVLREIRRIRGRHINTFVDISELGFSQSFIAGTRRPRLHGKGSFTFAKNFNLLFDTLAGHSSAPLRMMTVLGFATAFLGFLYAIYVLFQVFGGQTVAGWASLILVVLVLGGVQMIMLGVIGEYMWRTLENTRNRECAIESKAGDWNGTAQ